MKNKNLRTKKPNRAKKENLDYSTWYDANYKQFYMRPETSNCDFSIYKKVKRADNGGVQDPIIIQSKCLKEVRPFNSACTSKKG